MNDAQHRIYSHLIDEIIEGRLVFGDKIKSEVELARSFGSTRMNAHRAVKMLERHGLLEGHRKAGTLVAREITPPLVRDLRNELSGRVCVIRSRNRYEGMSWNDAFKSSLAGVLQAEGYNLEYVSLANIDSRAGLSKRMAELSADGLSALVVSVRSDEDRFVSENCDILFQYVRNVFIYQSCAEDWGHLPFHTVTVDYFGEGLMAGEFMIRQGCKNVAFCIYDYDEKLIGDSGMFRWLRERSKGVRFGVNRASDGSVNVEQWVGVENSCRRFLEGGCKHMLIAANDYGACKIIDRLKKTSALLPGRDYKIIGFDNSSDFFKYGLTTIAPPHKDIGRILGEMLLRRTSLKDRQEATEYLKVNSVLFRRQTA